MEMKVGIAQINISIDDRRLNFNSAIDRIHECISEGCTLLLLPELWYSGFFYKDLQVITKETKEVLIILKQICIKHQIYIAGSFLTQYQDKFFNSLIITGPGENFQQYKKIHLMHELREDKYFSPGRKRVVNQIQDLMIGSAICFDLRFPSLFSRMRAAGANIFLLPAQWPTKRIDHWKILIRSRAIENQSYVIAANGVGKSGSIYLGGYSQIIDPWGNILSSGGAAEQQIVTAAISTKKVEEIRSDFPFLNK